MKVLVTGASGFIGRQLIDRLTYERDKFDLVCMGRRPSVNFKDYLGDPIKYYACDLGETDIESPDYYLFEGVCDEHKPDVILFHSHGLAHPRRFGLASHLGVLFDIPSLGVADRVLVGYHDDIDLEKGHHTPLVHNGEEVGLALRTKEGVSPVFISVGHKADLLTTMDFTLECTTHYRRPEPIRQAHLAVEAQRDGESIDIDVGGDQTTLF